MLGAVLVLAAAWNDLSIDTQVSFYTNYGYIFLPEEFFFVGL
jgi:hypothetical protein